MLSVLKGVPTMLSQGPTMLLEGPAKLPTMHSALRGSYHARSPQKLRGPYRAPTMLS